MEFKIFFALSLPKMKISAPNHTDLAIFLTRLEDKEIAEKIEMGADTKESFTEVDEGSNVKN